jgi:hypothetical protein
MTLTRHPETDDDCFDKRSVEALEPKLPLVGAQMRASLNRCWLVECEDAFVAGASMVKDGAILDAVEHLRMCLAPDEFQIMDHWEEDLGAIGIASPSDLQRLVYFALESGGEHRFYVSLEAAPTEGSELPYVDCGKSRNVDLETLTEIVSNILEFGSSASPKPTPSSNRYLLWSDDWHRLRLIAHAEPYSSGPSLLDAEAWP